MVARRPPVQKRPATGWQKAKPYVLGIGVPVLVLALFIWGATSLFKSAAKSPVGSGELIATEPDLGVGLVVERPSGGGEEVVQPLEVASAAAAVETASTAAAPSTPAPGAAGAVEEPSESLVNVVDTAETRRRAQQRLQEEIDKMRQMYHERRQALLNEAVGFLRGTHSERGVRAKAANFRKLADQLLQKIDEFPEPSSEAEAKLWDAQKEELRKTADFLNYIANTISATRADRRRMRIAASRLEAEGAP